MIQLPSIKFKHVTEVPKGWGKEVQIGNIFLMGKLGPTGYSGKLLVYNQKGAKSSMHYHVEKHETFYVMQGNFTFYYYNPHNADVLAKILTPGDVVTIPASCPHQLICGSESGIIIEFSTHDYPWDNVRIGKGDSQAKPVKKNRKSAK